MHPRQPGQRGRQHWWLILDVLATAVLCWLSLSSTMSTLCITTSHNASRALLLWLTQAGCTPGVGLQQDDPLLRLWYVYMLLSKRATTQRGRRRAATAPQYRREEEEHRWGSRTRLCGASLAVSCWP